MVIFEHLNIGLKNTWKFKMMTGVLMLCLFFQGCGGGGGNYNLRNKQSYLPTHLPPRDSEKLRMELRLDKEQVQVIQTGQWILISIPSLFVFAEHTATISLSSYGMLNDVICFIKMFRKVEIDINVYESCCDKHQRMLALTRLRASRIADYFVSQGIDSRIVLTRGMANDKPIMKTDRSEYHLANSRIEILFKEEII
jgi:intracellular multiplication protein IcmN